MPIDINFDMIMGTETPQSPLSRIQTMEFDEFLPRDPKREVSAKKMPNLNGEMFKMERITHETEGDEPRNSLAINSEAWTTFLHDYEVNFIKTIEELEIGILSE